MWYMYTVEHCSARENEILPFVVMWMDREVIRLSEVRKSKTKTYVESKQII